MTNSGRAQTSDQASSQGRRLAVFSTKDIFKMLQFNAATKTVGVGFRELEPIIEKINDLKAYENSIDKTLTLVEQRSRNAPLELTKKNINAVRTRLDNYVSKVQNLVDNYTAYKKKLSENRRAISPLDLKNFSREITNVQLELYEIIKQEITVYGDVYSRLAHADQGNAPFSPTHSDIPKANPNEVVPQIKVEAGFLRDFTNFQKDLRDIVTPTSGSRNDRNVV